MNCKLLKQVKAAILAEPKQLDMDSWVQTYTPLQVRKHETLPACGTTACIAGHVAILEGGGDPENPKSFSTVGKAIYQQQDDDNIVYDVSVEARKALDLDPSQAGSLFYLSNWPQKFAKQYLGATNAEDRAQATADRIDHFIKTDGKE